MSQFTPTPEEYRVRCMDVETYKIIKSGSRFDHVVMSNILTKEEALFIVQGLEHKFGKGKFEIVLDRKGV